ncbi:hypothetical protein [Undibacterium pigrum]|uniref:Response regulatory domain-containing protein n=1 Tax=Undibacterium pigrum TaxID=401470 RepID=A0A318J277_9BURK|nr:hypothetical protein [Undibacterium pigrum]PXX40387.1 hypothetical protein DFR42_108222 [Undibacterium pigrum]
MQTSSTLVQTSVHAGRLQVLLVDDDTEITTLLARYLENLISAAWPCQMARLCALRCRRRP